MRVRLEVYIYKPSFSYPAVSAERYLEKFGAAD
jgi:hypothetical protein